MRLKLWLSLRDRRYNRGTREGGAPKFLLRSRRDVASRFDIEENDLRLISGENPNEMFRKSPYWETCGSWCACVLSKRVIWPAGSHRGSAKPDWNSPADSGSGDDAFARKTKTMALGGHRECSVEGRCCRLCGLWLSGFDCVSWSGRQRGLEGELGRLSRSLGPLPPLIVREGWEAMKGKPCRDME